MQVMIKFLNSTKKKTLKEQIINLELNKFSSLKYFSKKVLFILKYKYKINNIVFIDGGSTIKGCEYKYYLRFKTISKQIKNINFDDLENIINEKNVNQFKIKQFKLNRTSKQIFNSYDIRFNISLLLTHYLQLRGFLLASYLFHKITFSTYNRFLRLIVKIEKGQIISLRKF